MKTLAFFAASALLLAGCGSGRRDEPSPPPAPRRPATPQEAMGLAPASPLAAATEHWIADTDLGDAWAQAKENVADLEARLVADFRARAESGVGDTHASIAMRKDYDRWILVHDRLKTFILDCQANGRIRALPPDLARNFKNWSQLRRDLLRDAHATLDGLEADLSAFRAAFAKIRESSAPSEARLSAAETLSAKAGSAAASAEGLRAGAEALARHYAADEAVAGIASRATDAAADAKALAARVLALRGELHDAEAIRLFEVKVSAFADGVDRLTSLIAEKDRRAADTRALSESVADDIRAKAFSRLPLHRARLAALRAAAEKARPEELAVARAVKETAGDFDGALGAKAVRALRRELVAEASAARAKSLSDQAAAVVLRHGKTFDAALLNLQTSAFKLEDGASETEALAEAQKRLDRLDALSKR